MKITTQQDERAELPPLPEPDGYAAMTPNGSIIVPPSQYKQHNAYAVFTANQMREYARAAMLAADGKAGGEAVAWRTEAAKWLRMKAEDQRATNRQYPRHVECYPEWKLRELWISWLADELTAYQESAPPGLEPWQDDANQQPQAVTIEDIYRAMLAASPAGPVPPCDPRR